MRLIGHPNEISEVIILFCVCCVVQRENDKLICEAFPEANGIAYIAELEQLGRLIIHKKGYGKFLCGATRVAAKAVKTECKKRDINPDDMRGGNFFNYL